ncbi:hypothetical protein [Clostridioides sp. ZZV14-6045]|uniref:hypothetical protein n=1 Tax=Clostridioides sp. ZZV14-6045 TaxID=2811489 RepID=UPI001D10452D
MVALNKENSREDFILIMHAIYEQEKFKFITQKYFEVHMIKSYESIDEIATVFEDFLSTTILSKLDLLTTPAKAKKLRAWEISSTWRLKQNWVKMALDSLESDKAEAKLLKKEYITIKEEFLKNKGKIKSIDLESPEKLIEMRKKTLKEWATDSSYNISDFPYLSEMSEAKINSAFTHDLLLCITEILKEQYKFNINNIVLTTPISVVPGIFLPTLRPKRNKNIEIIKNDDNSFESGPYGAKNHTGSQLNISYKFKIDEENSQIESFKMELYNLETEEKALPKLSLDKRDLEIIIYIERLFNLDTASFYLSDLLKHLGLKSRTKANYDNVKNRLLKLPYYSIYSKSTDAFGQVKEMSFNFFSSVEISRNEGEGDIVKGRDIVKVKRSVSPDMERMSTDIMYENELKKIKLQQSINLAYFLEGRRNYLIRSGEDLQNKKYRFSIEHLKYEVHLSGKNSLKKNMNYLELGFNEIMENQFIIKDYIRGEDFFDVVFYENNEKQKCLLNTILGSLPDYIINNIRVAQS